MNIAQIQIKNVLGIKELSIEPGRITTITGRNGSGKSSVLGAIRAGLGAAEFAPAQLIHQGEEAGEVVLVFNDGTKVQRRIKADGTDVKVIDSDGNRYAKPQTVLDQLFALTQVNPLRLLATDKKSRDERARLVLESIPLTVTHEDLLRLAPTLASQVRNIDTSRHGLAVLDDAEKRIFERRTDVNRDFKKSSAAIMEMKATLPSGDALADPSAMLAELREKKAQLDRKREEYIGEFEAARRTARDEAHTKYTAQIEAAEARRQEAIRVANEAFEHERQASAEIRDRAIQTAEETYERQRSEKQTAYEQRLAPIQSELGRLEEQTRNAAAVAKQREILAKMTDENKELAILADRLTEDIESLRAYRKTAAEQMPIPGLELKDGEVYFHGLAFDQLNTAKRIELAVALAVQRAGDLGVICVDGCEALDSETMALLEERVLAAGLQMIATGVADEALTVQVKEVA